MTAARTLAGRSKPLDRLIVSSAIFAMALSSFLDRLDRPARFFTVSDALQQVYLYPSVTAASLSATSFETTCHLRFESVERFSGEMNKVRQEAHGKQTQQRKVNAKKVMPK